MRIEIRGENGVIKRINKMNEKEIKIEDLREDYSLATLEVSNVFESPIRQFQKWFKEAHDTKIGEPNIMTLATATKEGVPSARIVLLKGVSEEGFRFYTNYDSHKGQELKENLNVSLVFFWEALQRQVRIQGMAYRMTEAQSTEYFQSRPKGSQIGAWASPQSQVLTDRNLLEKNVAQLTEKYANENKLPKPPQWGGYLVKPYKIEFWQGRSSRLHDRLLYTLTDLEPTRWTIERLAP